MRGHSNPISHQDLPAAPEPGVDGGDSGEVSVLGAGLHVYRFQPGLRDERAYAAFTNGQCHALAFTLHQATAYPIFILLEDVCDCDLSPCPESFAGGGHPGWCCCQIVHFGVLAHRGFWLDITGVHPMHDVLTRWREQHGTPGAWLYPVNQQALMCVANSRRWRSPEVAAARSFVPGILAEYRQAVSSPITQQNRGEDHQA
jgi:hypothetical protein